jgi:hypothetical protein
MLPMAIDAARLKAIEMKDHGSVTFAGEMI